MRLNISIAFSQHDKRLRLKKNLRQPSINQGNARNKEWSKLQSNALYYYNF